jgi:Fur family ferric uptake transcriptional regulator
VWWQPCRYCQGKAIANDLQQVLPSYTEGVMGIPLGIEAPRHDLRSVDDVLALVRESGGRVTNSRRLLLEAIFDDPGHHSAEDLAAIVQARSPDVHLSTIYRNLEELERLGVVVHSHLGHGPATYHLAATAHCHFVCEHCGKAVKAPDELFVNLADRAKKEFGFTIDPHHFSILGRCRNCQ